MKKALITGINGQDGSFLAELLLSKGYKVYGFAKHRNCTQPGLADNIEFIKGDISSALDINNAIAAIMPTEIYNLASRSRPGESWNLNADTLNVNGMGAVYLFEAVRTLCPHARVYHASSSEMFGRTSTITQDESTPFNPTNPYAVAKVYAHQMAQIYRDNYKLFIANGILFNHESARRPLYFVSQKIAYGAACAALDIINSADLNEKGEPLVKHGLLTLGNLEIARDWGYAGDFVRAMWLMLQQDQAHDFVIGTGKLHTLKELCHIAYSYINKDWRRCVISDPLLMRPSEPSTACANTYKAQNLLNWHVELEFHTMIEHMVQAQIEYLASNQGRQA